MIVSNAELRILTLTVDAHTFVARSRPATPSLNASSVCSSTSQSLCVDVEGVLLADRFRGLVPADDRLPDSAGAQRQVATVLTEAAREQILRQCGEIADRRHAELGQLPTGAGAHAPQPLDAERREERRLVPGRDDDQAVRLAQIAGDLGHEPVRRDPH